MRFSTSRLSTGFTLVELLMVIVIIGIMGGMVVTATSGVLTNAREAKTRATILAVDGVVQRLYEDIQYRPLPVVIPELNTGVDDSNDEFGREVLGTEAARVRLLMRRDLLRMEVPDRYSDIAIGPISINAACNLVKLSGGAVVGTRRDTASRTARSVEWSANAKQQLYQDFILATATPENQGAECLYLILATTFVAGEPAIASLPVGSIADTDEDGMLEIVDGWGNPLAFVRWPVGYDDPTGTISSAKPDSFDPLRADFSYMFDDSHSSVTTPSSTAVVRAFDVANGISNNRPFSLRPLIISSGSDGEFGIAINPIDSSGTELSSADSSDSNYFSYVDASEWSWPKNERNMGERSVGTVDLKEYEGRGSAPYIFPDPYLRRFIADNDPGVLDPNSTDRRLPGQILDPASSSSIVADNIANFGLEAR